MQNNNSSSWRATLAQTGFVAKGIVYCLVGLLALMAALRLGGGSTEDASTTGALRSIEDLPAGKWLLLAVGVGLLFYAIWRIVEAFTQYKNESGKKRWAQVVRYLFSGIGYLSLGVAAVQMALRTGGGGGSQNSQQSLAQTLLGQPLGQWLLGAVALLFVGVGFYQMYYAFSEKYRKHVSDMPRNQQAAGLLLKTGKLGYFARGIVWVLIGWMLLQAALRANAAEAGNTAEAFGFLQGGTWGWLLLAVVAAGFVCYGIFCFVRARYERFN